jgi:hypothetical protein
MTSPISPHRTDPWIPHEDTTATGPATKVPVTARELPELPDRSAAAIANAVQAAKAGTARPLFAMGIDAAALNGPKSDTPIGQRLDAFKESATPTYHTPHEGDVSVAIPFRMTQPSGLTADSTFGRVEGRVTDLHDDLVAIAGKVGLGGEVGALNGGRATPGQIRRVTQALIDARRLPPPGKLDLASRVRTMMCNYGIGLDCAGYAQQAFLASRGVTRSQTQLGAPNLENLSNLEHEGFARINVADARPGDLMVLTAGRQVGHTAIVRDARPATADELQDLQNRDACKGATKKLDLAHLQVLVLDSSWGNSADALIGGVERRTWWHDDTNNKWVTEADGDVVVLDTPYDSFHKLEGVYRPTSEK